MAADSLSLPRAELAALFLESLFFGIFTVLYFISIWILLYREKTHDRSRLTRWMIATATTMFIFAIAHLSLDIQRAYDGFIVHGGTPTGTNDFYHWISNPTHVAKTVIYVTQTLVGDSFVIYRLWIVWNKMFSILVLPSLLLFSACIAGYGICYELAQTQGSNVVFASTLTPWVTSFFSISLTTNVLATILISGRILWSNHRVKQYRAGYAAATHWGVVEIVVQSAAMYSLALLSLLSTYVAESNAQYICLDSLQPLIGVVFTLIIIRVGVNEKPNDSGSRQHVSGDSRVNAVTHVVPQHGQQYPMRPLAINVSVSRTHDRGSFDGYDRKNIVDVARDVDLESGDGVPP